MPTASERASFQLAIALLAEFFGLVFFQIFGGAAVKGEYNGLVLMVLIYCTANLSGGVLNPAVTLALMIGKEMPCLKGLLYMVVQFLGAMFGSLILWGIDPSFNHHRNGKLPIRRDNQTDLLNVLEETRTGCVDPGDAARHEQMFGAELLGTTLLIATVFATAVSKKGFGHLAPLAIGFSIYVGVGATAQLGGMGGGAFNPARFFGPAVVLGCSFRVMWIYWLGEFGAGALCGLIWRITHTTTFLEYMKPVDKEHDDGDLAQKTPTGASI